ncbi:UNKNOWN [Stylonychia lemnae]|uniref:CUB domain-containing protein n=1 Tax=Stylonychia lemnae TaxID=5949 RepID=A0A078AGU1_STYLE|nr:UNKNOWN [Stylonychia lemnae]|eukprot:CDW81061.1 UNKNOWN [Stylonychia lemnae]
MRADLFSILILAAVIASTQALPNYSQCLDCFYTNRTNAYFCQSSLQCLGIKNPNCPSNQIVLKNYQCIEGYAECQNFTFTSLSPGTVYQNSVGLLPGYGCFIQIDRLFDGGYGTLQITFENPSVLVFDEYNKQYQSNDQLGLILNEDGWGPRKVFVVNSDPDSILGFTAVYSQGIISKINLIATTALVMIVLSLNII